MVDELYVRPDVEGLVVPSEDAEDDVLQRPLAAVVVQYVLVVFHVVWQVLKLDQHPLPLLVIIPTLLLLLLLLLLLATLPVVAHRCRKTTPICGPPPADLSRPSPRPALFLFLSKFWSLEVSLVTIYMRPARKK